MVTDPIADLLIRLHNASMVRKVAVQMPYSVMRHSIAKVLEHEGYVGHIEKKDNALSVALVYNKDGRPAINGIKRISKPSRRMYMGVRDIHPIRRGHGLLVLSTPAGVVSGKDARAKRVGGEVLFEIW